MKALIGFLRPGNPAGVRLVSYTSPIFNIPNALTVVRTALAFVSIALLVAGRFETAALAGMGVALFLDAVDGWVARRTGRVTAWGGFVDPLADKLCMAVLYGFLAFQAGSGLGWVLLGAVWTRDAVVTAARGFSFARYGEPLPARRGGKLKMVFQSLAGFGLLVISQRGWLDAGTFTNTFQAVLLVVLGMSLFSAAQCLAGFRWLSWRPGSGMQVRSESK